MEMPIPRQDCPKEDIPPSFFPVRIVACRRSQRMASHSFCDKLPAKLPMMNE
jgi:hypothetical protein